MSNERKLMFKKLSPENKQIVKKMIWYLSSRYLNEVCYEDLVEDIVGMALESEERGEKFSDAVGMDCEAFCRELVKNTPRQSVLERSMTICSLIISCIGVIVPVVYFLSLILPVNSDFVTHQGLDLIVSAPLILRYLVYALVFFLSWFLFKRFNYKSPSLVIALIACLSVAALIAADFVAALSWVSHTTMRINIALWLAIFGLLIVFALLAKKIKALYVIKDRGNGENR